MSTHKHDPVTGSVIRFAEKVAREAADRARQAATNVAREHLAKEAAPIIRQALGCLGEVVEALEGIRVEGPRVYDVLPPETRAIIDAHRRR